MKNILVIDHPLNCESIASCSIEHTDTRFFGINPSLSIQDNVNMCKPESIIVNKQFTNASLLDQLSTAIRSDIKIYEAPYIIPNAYIRKQKNNDSCVVICLHDHHLINQNTKILINNKYAPIYSFNVMINNIQMAGTFLHAKQLFEICDDHGSILDASGGYMEAFCKHYGWQYSSFKPDGSEQPPGIETYITNKELYDQIL